MTPLRMNKLLRYLLVLLVIAGLGLLYLGFSRLAGTAQKTAELKAQVEVNQKKVDVYERNKERVDSLSYVNELAQQVLPADQDQSAIVAEVSEFTLRSRLGIESLTFDDVADGPRSSRSASKDSKQKGLPSGVKIVPVTVQLKEGASYENVLALLETLEANRRKMQVTNISLKPSEEDRNLLESVVLKINLYAKQQEDSQ